MRSGPPSGTLSTSPSPACAFHTSSARLIDVGCAFTYGIYGEVTVRIEIVTSVANAPL